MSEIKRIATHVNVDIDAVIGTCCELIRNNLLPKEETVIFVPADTEKVSKGTLAVDIKARKHGKGKSYVGYYCRDILPHQVCDEVDEQDSSGRSSSRVPLCFITSGLAATSMSDLEIVQHMYPIVHGWIQLRIEWDRAKTVVATLPRQKIGDYEFLLSVDIDTRGLSGEAFQAGMNGTIFWGDDGCGITIYPQYSEELNLAHLKLEDWFTHPAGFLFAYGTRKAPKDPPPPQFQNVEEFIEYLKCQEVFYNSE